MCPLSYYQIMRNCKDKRAHRYQMVQYALAHGVKPTARIFGTSPPVVRKWLARFKEQGYAGLVDLSRRPHRSPRATAQEVKDHIVRLQKKYRRLGARQVKTLEKLPQAPKTIRKFWKEAGVSRRKRRKKYITKQNLREVKKKFYLFQQSCEDTKDLIDIPEYWPQMKRLNLPQVQYTRREISCGILFTGYANERSLIHATLFAAYINYQMKKYKALPKDDSVRLQTDNGSEFVGSWNAKEPSAYTRTIESVPNQEHTTIFPGAHRMQADVETVHGLMETEFYEIERFTDRADFMCKANTYQLLFNLERPNTYKEDKTPWQLAKEKKPDLDKRLLMVPAVDIDELLKVYLASFTQGGKNLLTNPFFYIFNGNGKRHRTPTPSRLRKIKRISFKAFLYLKGLFKDFRRETPKVQFGTNSLNHGAPRINNLETRIHVVPRKKNDTAIHYDYEPTRIQNTRDCLFWQWRRVAEWYRYINDPYENIRGT